MGQAADGVPGQTQAAGDLAQRDVVFQECVDGLVLFADAVGEPPRVAGTTYIRRGQRVVCWLCRVADGCRGWFSQQCPVVDACLLNSFCEVLPDVPFVRQEDRVRGAESSGSVCEAERSRQITWTPG